MLLFRFCSFPHYMIDGLEVLIALNIK